MDSKRLWQQRTERKEKKKTKKVVENKEICRDTQLINNIT